MHSVVSKTAARSLVYCLLLALASASLAVAGCTSGTETRDDTFTVSGPAHVIVDSKGACPTNW